MIVTLSLGARVRINVLGLVSTPVNQFRRTPIKPCAGRFRLLLGRVNFRGKIVRDDCSIVN